MEPAVADEEVFPTELPANAQPVALKAIVVVAPYVLTCIAVFTLLDVLLHQYTSYVLPPYFNVSAAAYDSDD